MLKLVRCAVLLIAWCHPPHLSAATVVIANRTHSDVVFQATPTGGKVRSFKLPSGELQPVRTRGEVEIAFGPNEARRTYALEPDAAYYFGADAHGMIDLQKLGLADEATGRSDGKQSAGRQEREAAPAKEISDDVVTIPVKILVDEEEAARREVWEARLTKRLEVVSAILQQHCFVRFEVVAFDTWQSDNGTSDFVRSLAEFEREVDPGPARLAIGFTSQYSLVKGRTHLGGTRGALRTHLLIREWSRQISEPERMEVLLHEVGHFLGAVHSPEPDSVMRPILGDRKARRKAFRVGFDPVNTLAMCLVSEELARRPLTSLAEASEPTQLALRHIYAAMIPVLPDDPVAGQYLLQVDRVRMLPMVASTRAVLHGVVELAEENGRLSPAPAGETRQPLTGDALAAFYVRGAAKISVAGPKEVAAQSFLVGLALALDRSNQLRSQPLVGTLARLVEPDDSRDHRLSVLGEPTARERPDALAHFFVSAALAVTLGAQAAESMGLVKEMRDAAGVSGFSFVDYQANLAGIRLATALADGTIRIETLAETFDFDRFLPPADRLPEGISLLEFERRYGDLADPRFERIAQALRQRIAKLPAYAQDAPPPPTAAITPAGE